MQIIESNQLKSFLVFLFQPQLASLKQLKRKKNKRLLILNWINYNLTCHSCFVNFNLKTIKWNYESQFNVCKYQQENQFRFRKTTIMRKWSHLFQLDIFFFFKYLFFYLNFVILICLILNPLMYTSHITFDRNLITHFVNSD